MTKMASRSLQADQSNALSKRARAAGEIEEASILDSQASWHQQAAISVHEHGNRLARQAVITHGEVATPASYMKDTLVDPDIAAVESSEIRGRLLHQNDVVALGVDIAKTVQASNTAEKLICHEIAVAHRVAMQQASWALAERDPNIEIRFFIDSTVNFHSLQQNPLFQIDCPCHERHRAVRTPSWTENTVVGEKGGPVSGRPAGGG